MLLDQQSINWQFPSDSTSGTIARSVVLPDANAVLRQSLNRRTLGVRLHLRAHNAVREEVLHRRLETRAQRGKGPGGLRYGLARSFGEPPVAVDFDATERTRRSLEALAHRTGFLGAQVQVHVDTIAPRRVALSYQVLTGPLWRIGSVDWQLEGSGIAQQDVAPTSPIVSGRPFDADFLETERIAMAVRLQSMGYADFAEAFISFLADTLEAGGSGKHEVDLTVIIRPQKVTLTGGIIDVPHATARFGEIRIREAEEGLFKPLRPEVLDHLISVETGMRYNQRVLEESYRRLMRLPALARVEMPTATRVDREGTHWLDLDISLWQRERFGFETEIDFTRTDARYGPLARVTWTDRNVSGRGDIFQLAGSGGIASTQPFSYTEASLVPNSGEWSLEAHYSILGIPPIGLNRMRPSNAARSEFILGFRRESRPDYIRKTFAYKHSFSFIENPARSSMIQLDLLEVSYSALDATEAFEAWLRAQNNDFLTSRFRDYAAALTRIQWRTAWRPDARFTGGHRISVEWAGQTLRLLSPSLGLDTDPEGHYLFGAVPFAQFVRWEDEVRWGTRPDGRGRQGHWAVRLFAGLGLAGENFGTLPYDRSFYGGGVNGLRGWATRGLGPGATGYEAPTEVIKGLGDLRLELNAEFRQPITSVLQLAWFTDAGNVWLTGNAPDEATWSRGGRWESLAWNTGLGLRLDFDFFLLRLDAGLRLHDPGLRSGDRWVGQHPARGAVHLGIGHPF